MVSVKEMKELIKNNIAIGHHTETHSDMRLASNRELEKEIITSKNKLEKQLGQKITYFAYPRGLYSKKIISFVKKAGFSHAFTVNGGSVSKNGFPYKINRISIEGSTTLSEFATLVSPIGAYYEHLFMKSLIVKESVSFSIKILLSDLYRNKINSKNKKTLVKLN
jgi:peptidoglycan/xylan/chitin deacetylase (PgdA/CDA1 family)